jgi:hypothetical protein
MSNPSQPSFRSGFHLSLGCHQQVLQGTKSLPELTALFRQWYRLFWSGAVSKIVLLFIERRAEARCRIVVAEPSHRIVALLDASMILFHSIIRIAVSSVHDFVAQHSAYGTRIGVMAIGGDSFGNTPGYLPGLGEELPCRGHVSVFREHQIGQFTIPINSSIQVMPFAAHFQVRFVHVPGSTSLALPSDT